MELINLLNQRSEFTRSVFDYETDKMLDDASGVLLNVFPAERTTFLIRKVALSCLEVSMAASIFPEIYADSWNLPRFNGNQVRIIPTIVPLVFTKAGCTLMSGCLVMATFPTTDPSLINPSDLAFFPGMPAV